MDDAQFWNIIQTSLEESDEDQVLQLASVARQLRELPPSDLLDFQRLYDHKVVDAQRWDLWGAAYLINGGCSDDGFVYFRSWLVSQGKVAYTNALKDPDSLASVVDPDRDDYEFEMLWYVSRDVYEELTGEEMPPSDVPWPKEPAVARWEFDDDQEAKRRLPNLAARYT